LIGWLCSDCSGPFAEVAVSPEYEARLILQIPKFSLVTDAMHCVLHWLPARQLHQLINKNSVFLSRKMCSVSDYILPLLVTSASRLSQRTSLAGEPLLWLVHSCGTSRRLPRELPAPTRRTASNEHWRRSGFNERCLVADDSTSKKRF